MLSIVDLMYPDRPRNAEALLLHPDGSAAVIGRGTNAEAFLVDNALDSTSATMSAIGSVSDDAEVRAGAVSADSRRVALRTVTEIQIWDLGVGSLATLAESPSRVVALEQVKAEAMTFAIPNRLVVTGEGSARGQRSCRRKLPPR